MDVYDIFSLVSNHLLITDIIQLSMTNKTYYHYTYLFLEELLKTLNKNKKDIISMCKIISYVKFNTYKMEIYKVLKHFTPNELITFNIGKFRLSEIIIIYQTILRSKSKDKNTIFKILKTIIEEYNDGIFIKNLDFIKQINKEVTKNVFFHQIKYKNENINNNWNIFFSKLYMKYINNLINLKYYIINIDNVYPDMTFIYYKSFEENDISVHIVHSTLSEYFSEIAIEYYLGDKLHNLEGPARIKYDKYGNKESETYYINDKKTLYVEYYDEYYGLNKIHKEEYFSDDETLIKSIIYFANGNIATENTHPE